MIDKLSVQVKYGTHTLHNYFKQTTMVKGVVSPPFEDSPTMVDISTGIQLDLWVQPQNCRFLDEILPFLHGQQASRSPSLMRTCRSNCRHRSEPCLEATLLRYRGVGEQPRVQKWFNGSWVLRWNCCQQYGRLNLELGHNSTASVFGPDPDDRCEGSHQLRKKTRKAKRLPSAPPTFLGYEYYIYIL